MRKHFSIVEGINLVKLDDEIKMFKNEFCYCPIICMSLQTAEFIHHKFKYLDFMLGSKRVLYEDCDYYRNIFYNDCLVLIDQNLNYGQIELR